MKKLAYTFIYIIMVLGTCRGVFGLSAIPIPTRRPTLQYSAKMKKVLMNSLKVRSRLETIEKDEDFRYQLLGTFWKKDYSVYIWDRRRNTIRVARGQKWKTIIELRKKRLRGFGLTKGGKLIVLTEQESHRVINDFSLGIFQTNGRRQTHLDFSSYLEHNNLTVLELDFPNFYLLQGDFTTQIDTLGKTKKVFIGEPMYGDEEDETMSVHVSLGDDHMLMQIQDRDHRINTNSDLKRRVTSYSFSPEQKMDHISATHRYKGQIKVVLEGQMQEDQLVPYYELHFNVDSYNWLSNRKISLNWIDPSHRQFWFYNDKIYMTEISGQFINTYRFK